MRLLEVRMFSPWLYDYLATYTHDNVKSTSGFVKFNQPIILEHSELFSTDKF
jgi:hypothetical protein